MPDSTDNGRITLAVLSTKLDVIEASVNRIMQKMERTDERQDNDCRRLDRIETTVGVVKWVLGPVGAIVVALVIDWLAKALLGA